jgi:hypothetical protein
VEDLIVMSLIDENWTLVSYQINSSLKISHPDRQREGCFKIIHNAQTDGVYVGRHGTISRKSWLTSVISR